MSSTTNTSTLPKAGTYTIDPAHTEVGFVARHLIGTKVRGRFTDASGTFTVSENPEESSVEAEVKTASIHTNQSMRDDHLRTNDFLDVEN
jgi:polyisoprenoid-binding protein YceI